MNIVELEESAVAINLLGSGELIIVNGWLEKYGLAASLTYIKVSECMACTLVDCSTTSSIKLLNTTLLYLVA